ncbi:MAG: bifunctional 4-hydroxy-2-oxoglutarate aldolase/2-dehydro-3-deoxy-phosphogluconate aldolase [Rikenellaceae bacterium]
MSILNETVAAKIAESKVIAVLEINDPKDAIPCVRALQRGGVDTIELALRTPGALEAIKIVKEQAPEIILGVGTVITKEQVDAIAGIGVDFAVAPGCNAEIMAACLEAGVPFAPGIATPSDIEMALRFGCRVMKYFPADTLGGMKHLNNMVAPYRYLGLKFIPLGGVSQENAAEYLKSDLITAIGGSWIAKRHLIEAGDWATIEDNARKVRELINNL